jgi:hypothetical protein
MNTNTNTTATPRTVAELEAELALVTDRLLAARTEEIIVAANLEILAATIAANTAALAALDDVMRDLIG